jgi:PAS domain S-box-containing protein/putative nucleotidyltransferase with HDIG domain
MSDSIRILIAEDLPTDVELAQREIHKTFPSSVFAQVETREAFTLALDSFQPDLIISDYNMPHFDGMTALRLAQERVPLIPVIIWTGSLNEDIAVDCMKAGASNYVIKEHIKRLGPAVVHALEEKQVRLERKRAEEALRVSEERYRTLAETANDLIFIIGIDNTLHYVNSFGLRAFDFELHDVIRRKISELIPASLNEILSQNMRNVLEPGKPINIENFIPTSHGEVWFSTSLVPLKDNAGNIYAVLGISRDITEQKRIEQALRESEARYRSRMEELEALFTLTKRLREAQSADEMLPVVLHEMCRVSNADACEITLPDATGERLVIALSEGSIASEIGSTFGRDEGLAGFVMRSCETYVTPDYATDPYRMTNLSHTERVGPAIFAPLQSENQVLGVLVATRRRSDPPNVFLPEEVRLLTAMGEMAGNALRRVRLFDDVQRHLSRTQSLHDIQLTVASSFDLSRTLVVALENAITQLRVDAAAVLLFDPQTNTLEYTSGRGFKTEISQQARLRLGEGYAGRTLLEGRMLYLPNLNETGGKYSTYPLIVQEGFVAYCGVPLVTKGQIKGVLEIFQRTPLAMDREQRGFLETLAGQVAIGIDNLTLLTDLQHSNLKLAAAYDATIEGLSHALDLRDKETEGHTQRVVDLTLRLARELGMSEAELVHVRRGALLHDIGKLGIPDAILLKPDQLTDEEWAIMRRHPQYGFEMLATIDYLRPALDIPHYHHEKWDGSGYPNGLKGEEIPLKARLFAVVDVWDALINERPYRFAWSPDLVLDYIREQSGKQFDPSIVRIFLNIIAEQHV